VLQHSWPAKPQGLAHPVSTLELEVASVGRGGQSDRPHARLVGQQPPPGQDLYPVEQRMGVGVIVMESVSTGVMKGRVDVVEEVGRTGGL
jgi:hypothetical protein